MKNDGFTLVEVVVAVVVSVFASASILLILNLGFTQYKLSRSESQIEIEAQEMTEKLKPIFMCCESVEQPNIEGSTGKYIRVKSTNPDGDMVYYNIILEDSKVYLVTSYSKIEFEDLTWNGSNYMAQYVESIGLEPNNYDFSKETSFDTIECQINLATGGVDYTTSFLVRIRGN